MDAFNILKDSPITKGYSIIGVLLLTLDELLAKIVTTAFDSSAFVLSYKESGTS